MKSVTSWLERKLFLKVSATKTKVVRPMKSEFLGFGFWKGTKGWKCKPLNDRKKRLYKKCKEILVRKRAAARPLSVTFNKLNQVITQTSHTPHKSKTMKSSQNSAYNQGKVQIVPKEWMRYSGKREQKTVQRAESCSSVK